MLQKKRKKDNISGKEKFGFGTWAIKCIIFFFLNKKMGLRCEFIDLTSHGGNR